MTDQYKMILAIILFAVGQCLVWFQINSQFVWEWWAEKPWKGAILYSIPAGLCFLYGVKLTYEVMHEVWGPRFLIFGMSYLTFPILTWYFLNESMFTAKTLTCVFLSFVILGIQLLWK